MRLPNVIDWNWDMKSRMTVTMSYLPTLSVNRYKTAQGIIRREVKEWMDELTMVLLLMTNSQEIKWRPPIKLRLDAQFKDRRHPDLHNLIKPICDSVKEGIGIDDKHFRVEDGDVVIAGKDKEPRLRITVEGMD